MCTWPAQSEFLVFPLSSMHYDILLIKLYVYSKASLADSNYFFSPAMLAISKKRVKNVKEALHWVPVQPTDSFRKLINYKLAESTTYVFSVYFVN